MTVRNCPTAYFQAVKYVLQHKMLQKSEFLVKIQLMTVYNDKL